MLLRLVPLAVFLLASGVHAQTPEVRDLPLDDALRDHLVGRYSLTMRDADGPALSLRLFVEEGALLGAINDNDPTRMLYQGDRRFRPEDAPVVLLIAPEAEEARLVVETPDGVMDGVRVGEAAADPATSGPLFEELREMDRTLFDAIFVACDPEAAIALLDADVEFYHDKVGVTRGQEVHDAIRRQAEGCPREQGLVREVILETLLVSPVPGFGAVQMGEHRFIQAEETGRARFAHVWRQTEDGWRVHRVLSIDHRTEE
ncbi:MAG: nuclear transport factor 2 family protein [Bacteroidota bacterium]